MDTKVYLLFWDPTVDPRITTAPEHTTSLHFVVARFPCSREGTDKTVSVGSMALLAGPECGKTFP